MIKSWKLSWTISLIKNQAFLIKNKQVLSNPNTFWFAAFLKLVPILKSIPINLYFKAGGKVKIIDFMSLYMYTEIFIDECYDIQLDEKSLNIIDIGSNVGMFIIRMKQLYPQCLINGYEPLPANFKQLSDNLKENHYQNYEVFQKGIGNSKRIEKLYINLKNNGGNSLFKNQTNSSVYTEIELIDVDEMLKNLGHENCNLLKLDCEGAELEILKSLTPETAARIKRIIYEPTPSIYNPLELNDYLVTLGYIFEKETLYGLYIAYYSGKPN